MKLEIRKATIIELDIIFDIFQKAISSMNENNIFQWDDYYPNRDILKKDIIKGQMYLSEVDKKISSLFVLNQECDEEYNNGNWQYKDSTFLVLHRLCVNPVFQNRGIGRQTMLIIEDILKDNNVEIIRLDTFSLNPYALGLYERLGYKKVGIANFRKGLFYLYEKKIITSEKAIISHIDIGIKIV